jgi:hypothetical protein
MIIYINHPSLDSPVWLEFTQSKNLDEEKILGKIEGVQQSKKEFVISDGGMEIDFFHVKYPEGSGGNLKKTSSLAWTRKILRRRREPSCRLSTPGILCACPVPLLLPVFMPRNLKFLTRSGRRNGNGCD